MLRSLKKMFKATDPIATFDIEISNVFDLEDGQDLLDFAPFDISVAATEIQDGEQQLWYSKDSSGSPGPDLNKTRAKELLYYLHQLQLSGHRLVAWNGLSFDLRWIGHVAGDMERARAVALDLYDPMFQFFKVAGFPVSLAKVAEGLGIRMKKLMDGADAPVRWQAGDYESVFQYVLGDTRLTLLVAKKIDELGEIRWITQRGKISSKRIGKMRQVKDCLRDPMPDQSWMDMPIPESNFSGWLFS